MLNDEDTPQSQLFDTDGKNINPDWIDPNQSLFIPNNPLHWKAHKLQILIQRLEVQSKNNPAQFNSKNYIDSLNEYERLITEIKQRESDKPRTVVANGYTGTTPEMGSRDAVGLGSGISTDNPLAR